MFISHFDSNDRYEPSGWPDYVRVERSTFPPTQGVTLPPRPELGYLSVEIDSPRSTFPPRTNIMLPCTVNSYTKPVVYWEKNGQRLPENSLRIVVRMVHHVVNVFKRGWYPMPLKKVSMFS